MAMRRSSGLWRRDYGPVRWKSPLKYLVMPAPEPASIPHLVCLHSGVDNGIFPFLRNSLPAGQVCGLACLCLWITGAQEYFQTLSCLEY